MAEIDYITIRGFKSIASIEKVRLAPINVIIGPNGSGKSNFVEVFSFLHAIRNGRLRHYVDKAGGADRLLHFGSKTTDSIAIHISFENETNRYEIALEPQSGDTLFPAEEKVYFWDKAHSRPWENDLEPRGFEAGISAPDPDGVQGWVRDRLARWRVYHFQDTGPLSPMKTTAAIDDNRFLRANGSNLAPFLYFLQEAHADAYGLIRDTIRRAAPFFDDFVLEPMRLNTSKIKLEWRHMDSDDYFDVAALSDGTLRFMALTTLLLQPATYRPSVVLMDEPELGLHPYAITLLGAMIRMAARTTQVIAATQSPTFLDQFAPEDVLVADRTRGGTQLGRLDSEQLRSWLADYSLGQLWEKNEIGGRPSGT